MSTRSCATGSVRSLGGSLRLGPPGLPAASSHELVLDALYERKRDKKSVRVLTVIIYVFCVSLAAIMLSLYYVFFWEPKDAQYAQRKVSHTVDQQTSTTPMPTCFMPYTGGGDSTVKVNATPTDSANAEDASGTSTPLPTTTDEYSDTANSVDSTGTSVDSTATSVDSTGTEHVAPSATHPPETLNITDVT